MAHSSDRKMGPHEALEALTRLKQIVSTSREATEKVEEIEEYLFNHKCYEASASFWKSRALNAELRLSLAVKSYPDLMEAVLTAVDKQTKEHFGDSE